MADYSGLYVGAGIMGVALLIGIIAFLYKPTPIWVFIVAAILAFIGFVSMYAITEVMN